MKTLLSAIALLAAALGASAQTAAEPKFETTCNNNGSWGRGDKAMQQFCETRDLTMPATNGQTLTVDGGPNGGITVRGWDGPNVRVRAKVQTWASTEAEAATRAHRISIATQGNTLRAGDPNKENNWSVSYEIFVPRTTALALNTTNGGIHIENVQAAIRFETTNGGVSLANLGGSVKGETTNGGLNIALNGSQWQGQGLDVSTTNGGIHWKLPRAYSARLVTSTNMGGIRTDLPVTKTGMFHKEVEASLGLGGATVKAVTTNGGISVDQAQD
jgi:hypothetical protein